MLRRAWRVWIDLVSYIGAFQSRLLLTLFYFTVALPFGLLARWLFDPFRTRRRQGPSGWHARPRVEETLDVARRQF